VESTVENLETVNVARKQSPFGKHKCSPILRVHLQDMRDSAGFVIVKPSQNEDVRYPKSRSRYLRSLRTDRNAELPGFCAQIFGDDLLQRAMWLAPPTFAPQRCRRGTLDRRRGNSWPGIPIRRREAVPAGLPCLQPNPTRAASRRFAAASPPWRARCIRQTRRSCRTAARARCKA